MMLKRQWGFVILIMLLWSADIAVGADRFVSSATGDDLNGLNDCRDQARPCATIKQAIEKADPGDTIEVLAGPPYTKDCGIEIKKQLTILAEGVRPLIAPAAAVDEAEEPCKGKSFLFKFSGEAAGSMIMGLALRARIKEKKDAALIIVENIAGSTALPAVTIKDNQLRVLKNQGDATEVGIALRMLDSTFVEIIGNQIQGTLEPVKNAQGISLEQRSASKSLDGSRIEENRIFNHGGAGIEIAVEDHQASSEHPLRLLRNRVEKNEGFGVSIVKTSNLVIEGNEIVTNGLTGVDFSSPCPKVGEPEAACESVALNANAILNNGDEGIHLQGSPAKYDGLQISNNIMQKNGLESERPGLRLAEGLFTRSRIIDNRLEGNYMGIQIEELEGGSSLELVGNNISEHKGGDGLKIKLTDATGATKLIVRGNTTDQNSGSGLVLEGFNTTEGSEIKIEGLKSRGNKEGVVLKGAKGVKDQKITTIPSIKGSQLEGNRCAGLVLEDSSLITIENNTIAQNGRGCSPDRFQLEGAGIVLKGSSDKNSFKRNVLDRNLNGISLRLSKGTQEQEEKNDFQCNTISNSDHSGIFVLPEANVTALADEFKNNNIVGNLGFGLRNFTDINVNAQQNWWGDKSGPRHETNPNGKGDRILGPADFSNWLTQAVDINRCP
jgi:parallel beta-helix repeat protein